MSNNTFELKPDFTAYEMAEKEKHEAAQKGFASPFIQKPQVSPAEEQNKGKFEPLPFGYFYQFNNVKNDRKNLKKGIYKVIPAKNETEESTNIRIGDLLYFIGYACNENDKEWGMLCKWVSPSGQEHIEIIPFEKLTSITADWFSILSSGGYRGNRKELAKIFQEIEPQKRFILLDKIGWRNKSYILPNRTITHEHLTEEYFFNSSSNMNNLYTSAGTQENWQEVKKLIQGNSRLEFAYIASFAGVLLDLANFESMGFALEGASSSGKTTALQVASAVWGGKEHIGQWRATTNGLEGIAVLHNDNVLILDELGQVTGKDLDNAIYMLANGQGKSRATKNGDSRQAKKWRLLFLSSGEIGIAQKLAEDGKKAKAGQEVRFIALFTDKEHISNLHDLKNAKELVDKVKNLTAENYGFDGIKFIEFVVTHYESISTKIKKFLKELSDKFYQGKNTQISRVATHFALIEYTRILLIEAKLVPDDFAAETIKACFGDWLAGRDNTDSHEEKEILDAVKLFIESYPNKFQNVNGSDAYMNEKAGYKDLDAVPPVYYFSTIYFKENVVNKFDIKFVCKVLERNGWLITEQKDRYTIKKTFEKSERKSYYAITIEEKD